MTPGDGVGGVVKWECVDNVGMMGMMWGQHEDDEDDMYNAGTRGTTPKS